MANGTTSSNPTSKQADVGLAALGAAIGVAFAMILSNQVAAAILLLTLTLCLQCAGVTTVVEWLKRVLTRDIHKHGPIYSATLVVRSTIAIIVLHGLVILLWASFYRSRCFPSWELAFYFSASSYSTVGYGDMILPSNWRLLGPLEGIIGVLMCGISVSVLFALVTRLLDRDARSSQKKEDTLSPLPAAASADSSEQSHA
jgi:voltage-gated potassium channel